MIKCENACPRGKFDGCCHKCPDFHTCPDSCQEDPNTCGSSTFDEAQRRITAKLLSVPVEDVTVITKDAYDAATEEPEDDFDDRDW